MLQVGIFHPSVVARNVLRSVRDEDDVPSEEDGLVVGFHAMEAGEAIWRMEGRCGNGAMGYEPA